MINYTLVIILICFIIYRLKSKNARLKIEDLSKQEIKVKKHIIEGKTNKEIAAALFISLSTVKTHVSNIYSKLNIRNRNELITQFRNNTGTST